MNNPYYYPQYQRNINPWGYTSEMPKSADDKIYVQGLEAAKAYLVTAGGFVRLWDSTSPVFYEKTADARGIPSIMAFKYEAVNLADNGGSDNKRIMDYDERLKGIESRLNRLEGATNEQSDADAK